MSHWWGEEFKDFVAALDRYATDRCIKRHSARFFFTFALPSPLIRRLLNQVRAVYKLPGNLLLARTQDSSLFILFLDLRKERYFIEFCFVFDICACVAFPCFSLLLCFSCFSTACENSSLRLAASCMIAISPMGIRSSELPSEGIATAEKKSRPRFQYFYVVKL